MESLKRSMKAALMTPLVSSLALTCEETPVYLRAFPGDSADRQNTLKGRDTPQIQPHSHWNRGARPSGSEWWGWSWAASLYSWSSSRRPLCVEEKRDRVMTDGRTERIRINNTIECGLKTDPRCIKASHTSGRYREFLCWWSFKHCLLSWISQVYSVKHLPSFNLREVKGNLSVRHSLLVQVSTVPPDERGHVVTWQSSDNNSVHTRLLDVMSR